MSDNSLTFAKDNSARLSKARQVICLEAAWEIDALARTLATIVPYSDDTDVNVMHFAVRGLAARVIQLSEALMSGLGDAMEDVRNIQQTVTLEYPSSEVTA